MTQLVAFSFLVLFTVLMIVIGLKTAQKAKTIDGFLLGGRKIGPWISAFSYGTAYFSAVIFIGYAGRTGWTVGVGGIWIGIGNALLGCLLAWLLLARRTRHMTHNLHASTMPEFFEKRFGSKNMKLYAALIIFIFLVPYCATVYKGLGYLFSQIFPIFGTHGDIVCMFIIAVLTAIYLVLGGYFATTITDFIQGIIMLFGVTVMVIVVVSNPVVGGFSDGFAKLKTIDPSLISITGGSQWRFLLMNILLTSFGTLGLPQMIHKYYAIGDEKQIPKAAVVSTVFALVIGVGAYTVGTFGRLYLNNTLPDGGNFDAVIPCMLMNALSGNVWTNIILSVILLLVLSASMSTLSSIVLTSSSAIAVDLLPVVVPDYNKKGQMILMRALCFVFIAASFIFASFKVAFIMQLMSFSWGVVAGCFIGPYIWGLYSKKISRAGVWCGLLSGLLVVGGCTLYVSLTDSFAAASNLSQNFGVAAMAISIIVTPLVSLFTQKSCPKEASSAFEGI
ncbi:MAG: sodium:solute symporter family protein [Ruminococcaceae bacterium]|nr:sodium:solute symporter family protein [Oscillospiraceae bacterium]